jgi:hypothetical protein
VKGRFGGVRRGARQLGTSHEKAVTEDSRRRVVLGKGMHLQLRGDASAMPVRSSWFENVAIECSYWTHGLRIRYQRTCLVISATSADRTRGSLLPSLSSGNFRDGDENVILTRDLPVNTGGTGYSGSAAGRLKMPCNTLPKDTFTLGSMAG